MEIIKKHWSPEVSLKIGEMSLEFRSGFGWWLSRDDGEGAQIQSEDVERMLSEFLGQVM